MNTGANYVFFGNNEFILAGRDNPGTQWAKSTDGKTWTAVTGLGVRAAGGGAYGNGAWVLGSNGHNVLVKADSGDWATKDTGIADPNINWVNGVAFGKGTFVITGMNGRIAWSGDTLAWTDVSPLDSSNEPLFGTGAVNSVVFGNERFVAVGGSPNIAVTSTDGKTWTQTGSIGIITERDFLYAGFGGGVFLAGHQNGGWSYSTDAEKWTAIPSVPLEGSTGIAYGNGQFVMVGGAKIAWSTPE
jgi:hypothetical protein